MTPLWLLMVFTFFSVWSQTSYNPFTCVPRSPKFLERNLRGFYDAGWRLWEWWGGLRRRWQEPDLRQPPLRQPGWLGSDLVGVLRVLVRCTQETKGLHYRVAGVDGGSVFFVLLLALHILRMIIEVSALPRCDLFVGRTVSLSDFRPLDCYHSGSGLCTFLIIPVLAEVGSPARF